MEEHIFFMLLDICTNGEAPIGFSIEICMLKVYIGFIFYFQFYTKIDSVVVVVAQLTASAQSAYSGRDRVDHYSTGDVCNMERELPRALPFDYRHVNGP